MGSLSRRRFLALTTASTPVALALGYGPAAQAQRPLPPSSDLPRVRPLTRPGNQPRRRNFEVSAAVVSARVGERVTFEGHKDSRTIYIFLDREGLVYAPFGVERLELDAREEVGLEISNGVPRRSYRYLVYLVDHDDLADGSSPPRIYVAV